MSRPTLRLYDGSPNTSPELSPYVSELQTLLQAKGYRINPNGVFDAQTDAVVRLYQQSRGLKDDGIFGPKSWAMILQVTTQILPDRYQTTYPTDTAYLLKELDEANKYKEIIYVYCKEVNLLPSLIAGLGSRESRWGLALKPVGPGGLGDHGYGHGLLQVDKRSHVQHTSSGDWKVPEKHLAYGIKFLRYSIDLFARKSGANAITSMRGGVAGYNCGVGNSLKAFRNGLDIDYFTANRNYSKDTFDRAGWFQLHGWD